MVSISIKSVAMCWGFIFGGLYGFGFRFSSVRLPKPCDLDAQEYTVRFRSLQSGFSNLRRR